jgi:glycosyltransferase involved in cell wall biosynthesis
MLWSLLIAGIPERFHTVQPLLLSLLEHQHVARMPDVELLYFLDNRRRSVGAKRNDLLAAARGEYVSWIDDDDEVANDYVAKVYREICKTRKTVKIVACEGSGHDIGMAMPADVICFPQRATIQPAGIVHECTYSLAHWKDRKPEERRQLAPSDNPNTFNWSGPPAHTMCWRRDLVKDIPFEEKQFGEDVNWVDKCCEKAKSEVQIQGSFLYHYKFAESGSATR